MERRRRLGSDQAEETLDDNHRARKACVLQVMFYWIQDWHS